MAIGEEAEVQCESIEDSVVLSEARVKVVGAIRHALIGGAVNRQSDVIGERVFGEEALAG
ncbi:MAG: hypothetical protein HY248_05820 [Fimbriimonas ginsengisoli]|nr:hypothetical protein [Fimbriimonas ginsengisoli]